MSDKDLSFGIKLFGRRNYYRWRSIALSGIFKTLIFLLSQLSHNFVHPSRINVIPLPVTINRIDSQIYIMNPKNDFRDRSNASISSSNNIDTFIQNERRYSTIQETPNGRLSKFSINMPIEMTLYYVISRKLFKFSISESVYYSRLFSQKKIVISTAVLFMTCFVTVFAFKHQLNGIVTIVLEFTGLCCVILLFLHLNWALFHFKKRSLVLYWKLYNVITLYIAVFFLNYKYKLDEFANEFDNIGQSIVICTVHLLIVIFVVFGATLHQGYNISAKYKLLAIFLIIATLSKYMMYYYFADSFDFEFTIATFGQNISLRSVIISSSFDLILWFSFQFYQLWTNPEVVYLVSKIEMNYNIVN